MAKSAKHKAIEKEERAIAKAVAWRDGEWGYLCCLVAQRGDDKARAIVAHVDAARAMLAALRAMKGELAYVHETGDVRDSIRNSDEARRMTDAAIAAAEAAGIKAN